MVHWQLLFFNDPCCMLYIVSCISKLYTVVCPGNSPFYPPLTLVPQLGVSLIRPWNSLKFQALFNTSQIMKMVVQDAPQPPNVVQSDAWNHQIIEKVEKVKSYENHSIYYVFERLGHQKTDDFPFKSHQRTCLQCKWTFGHSRSPTISKMTQNRLQLGTPNPSKIFKIPPWDPWGSPWVHPCPTWSPKRCQTGPSRSQYAAKMVSEGAGGRGRSP